MSVEALQEEGKEFRQMPQPTYQTQPCKPMQTGKVGSRRTFIMLRDVLGFLCP